MTQIILFSSSFWAVQNQIGSVPDPTPSNPKKKSILRQNFQLLVKIAEKTRRSLKRDIINITETDVHDRMLHLIIVAYFAVTKCRLSLKFKEALLATLIAPDYATGNFYIILYFLCVCFINKTSCYVIILSSCFRSIFNILIMWFAADKIWALIKMSNFYSPWYLLVKIKFMFHNLLIKFCD